MTRRLTRFIVIAVRRTAGASRSAGGGQPSPAPETRQLEERQFPFTSVVLATGNNNRYRTHLGALACAIHDVQPPLSGSSLPDARAAAAIIELGESGVPRCPDTARLLADRDFHIIAVGEAADDDARVNLQKLGIADVLPSSRLQVLARYLACCAPVPGSPRTGSLLALERAGATVSLLSRISARFGYAVDTVDSMDGLFEQAGERTPSIILINLDCDGFEVERFVRRAHSDTHIRKAPLIVYKNTGSGIFVHELTSGLNRHTRAILDTGEMLSLLVHLLFRAHVSPRLRECAVLARFDDLIGFSQSGIARIYGELGPDVCATEYLFNDIILGRVDGALESVKSAFLKVAGLSWLVNERKQGPTCGAGV